MKKLRRTIRFGLCYLLIGVALSAIGFGNLVLAASLTQGYHSDSALSLGSIVSTDKANGNNIELTTLNNQNTLVGVIVDSKQAIIDLQPHGTDVRVALNGQVSILVTDLNGDIKSGDNLIVSPLSGVATKDYSGSTAKKYLATASEAFNKNSNTAHQVSVSLADGSQKTVNIGTIQAQLTLTDRPVTSAAGPSNLLTRLANKVAGKPVNTARLIAATAVFMTTISFTGLLLHGSVKGSFISLGRNPLSKPLIVNNLFKMLAFGMLIVIAGTALAYFILAV